jgi:cyclopropane-fatty-acyl-phospholipid synthase
VNWLLRAALAHIAGSNLRVTSARGITYQFGDGSGIPIAVRFTSHSAQWAVLLDPAHFVDLVARYRDRAAWPWWAAPASAVRFARRRLAQHNLLQRARRNVAHHYDLAKIGERNENLAADSSSQRIEI